MSKAIFVMDMPNVCWECSLCQDEVCLAADISTIDISTDKGKPDWCPLKPIPKKAELTFIDHGQDQIAMGWNACIDELLKDGV